MEQVNHQWVVEEEEELQDDAAALEGRQSLQHRKDVIVSALIPSFCSSPTGSGSGHSHGVCSASLEEPPIQKEEEPPTQKEEESPVHKEEELPTQKEEEVAEMGSVVVVENATHFNDDSAAVWLGPVAEFVGAATNGEAQPIINSSTTTTTINVAALQNKNSVYFDKQEGMWKCHHCTWTKRFDSPRNLPLWNLKGNSDWLMNVKTMIQHGPCFVCETKGNEEVNGLKGVQNGDCARPVLPKSHGEVEFVIQVENSDIQNSPCNEVSNQCMETVDDKVSSTSELPPLPNSSEVQVTTVKNFGDESSAESRPNLIKEIDQQPKEYDVETVVAKQETHDLFCPNCKSCITKRVILRKRKRNNDNFDTKAKPDELDTKLVNSSAHEANQSGHEIAAPDVGSLEPPADNYEPEREREVFRCLSCFSFFIPTRNGFKLFPNFGGAREPETSQNTSIMPASNLENPSNIAASNATWFFSLFNSNKGKKASEQGDASLESSRTGPDEQQQSSSITTNIPTSPEINPEGPLADTAISNNVKPTPDIKPGHEGVNSPIPSTVKSGQIESWIENGIKSNMSSGNELLADQKCLNPSFQNDLSSIQSCTQRSSDLMKGLQKGGIDFIDFSAKEQLLTEKVRTDVGEKKNDSVDMIKTDSVAGMSLTSISNDMGSKHESVQLATGTTTEIHFNAGKHAKDAILKSYEGEPEYLVPSTVASQKDVDKTLKIAQSSYCSLMQEAQSPAQSFGSAIVANDVASDKQSSGVDATIPSEQDFTLIKKVQNDVEEEINPSVGNGDKGSEVIVFVQAEPFKSSTSQTADNVSVEGAIVTETHTQQPRGEIGEPQEWEILKSIVYGGLIESITSLGIVSSAAGSGAAPLNIIALGLANLIGGLFTIGHKLIELKNDHSGGDPQQMNMQEDRYQELLGRRANFLLHAIVVVLSFLIFGSVPLVVYGLLIRKNYYAEVKLAAVAATSLVLIILLAIGKVYTRRPPKSYTKTVLHYVTVALAASGVSYIVGDLLKDLLEKFSRSEPGFVLTIPFSGTRSVEPAWMSY